MVPYSIEKHPLKILDGRKIYLSAHWLFPELNYVITVPEVLLHKLLKMTPGRWLHNAVPLVNVCKESVQVKTGNTSSGSCFTHFPNFICGLFNVCSRDRSWDVTKQQWESWRDDLGFGQQVSLCWQHWEKVIRKERTVEKMWVWQTHFWNSFLVLTNQNLIFAFSTPYSTIGAKSQRHRQLEKKVIR